MELAIPLYGQQYAFSMGKGCLNDFLGPFRLAWEEGKYQRNRPGDECYSKYHEIRTYIWPLKR